MKKLISVLFLLGLLFFSACNTPREVGETPAAGKTAVGVTPAPSLAQHEGNYTLSKETYNAEDTRYKYVFHYFRLGEMENGEVQQKINSYILEQAYFFEKEVQETLGILSESDYKGDYVGEGTLKLHMQAANCLLIDMDFEGSDSSGNLVHSTHERLTVRLDSGAPISYKDFFAPGFDAQSYFRRAALLKPGYPAFEAAQKEGRGIENTEIKWYAQNEKTLTLALFTGRNYSDDEYYTADFPLAAFGQNFLLWDVLEGLENPVKYTNVGLESFLNIRNGPDASAKIEGVLLRWEAVEVLQETGQWSKVKTAGNITGYVKSQYLSADPALKN